MESRESRGGLDPRSARFPFRAIGISLLLLLVLLVIWFNPFGVVMHSGPVRLPSAKLVNDVATAAETYVMWFKANPSRTGTIDLDTGQATPFAPGEEAVADAIHCCFGKAFVDPGTGKATGPFLLIKPDQVRMVNGRLIVVDSWGNPLRFDVVPDREVRPRLRVWSMGPDGKEGSVPFSRVDKVTDPRDEDNKASWR